MRLNLDTDELTILSNKLERLNRSAFPVAVRQTLDGMAFDMRNEVPKVAQTKFRKRSPGNVWKFAGRVNKARGFDVQKMQAEYGFRDLPRSNFSENQKQQERGGKIGNRQMIALDGARGGSGAVRKPYRISSLRNKTFVDANRITKRRTKGGGTATVNSRKEKMIVAMHVAKKNFKRDAYVLGSFGSRSRFLFHVKSIRGSSDKLDFNIIPIYKVNEPGKVDVRSTHYISEASERTKRKGVRIFKANANRQFKKAGVK